MPSNKVIAAFYVAGAVILYCAYSTLVSSSFDPSLPSSVHVVKRVTK